MGLLPGQLLRGLEIGEVLMIRKDNDCMRRAYNEMSPFSSAENNSKEFAIVSHVVSLSREVSFGIISTGCSSPLMSSCNRTPPEAISEASHSMQNALA